MSAIVLFELMFA